MKKIFILFYFILNIYVYSLTLYYFDGKKYFYEVSGCVSVYGNCEGPDSVTLSDPYYPYRWYTCGGKNRKISPLPVARVKGVAYKCSSSSLLKVNLDCVLKNLKGPSVTTSSKVYEFCRVDNHSDQVYSPFLNAWVSSDGKVFCSPDAFNVGEKCSNICKKGNIYFSYNGQNYCISPDPKKLADILGNNAVSSCSFKSSTNGNLLVYSANGETGVVLQCGNFTKFFPYADSNFSLRSDDSNLSSGVSNSSSKSLVDFNDTTTCYSDEHLVVYSDGSVSCEKDTMNNSSNNSDNLGNSNDSSSSNNSNNSGDLNNTTSGNSNNSNNSSNSSNSGDPVNSNNLSNSNNSGDSNSSNNSKRNCCYYYNHQSLGDVWHLVNNQHCSDKYNCCIKIFDNGVCQDVSNSSNSNGSGANININMSGVESRLDNINHSLNNIVNLKPDGSSNFGDVSLSDDEKSFLSNISDTFKNVKTSLNNLQNSVNQIKSLLDNPKKFTLFSKDNVVSCPLVAHIYNSDVSLDICKFVSPYKPLLQLFFTIFFSLSVIFYFFDIFLRSKQ